MSDDRSSSVFGILKVTCKSKFKHFKKRVNSDVDDCHEDLDVFKTIKLRFLNIQITLQLYKKKINVERIYEKKNASTSFLRFLSLPLPFTRSLTSS